VCQILLASSGPVRFGPGSEHPLPAEAAKRFSIQSQMAMAIHPKVGKPYMLGLHQCSYPRVWMPQEERLFQEIGRRLEDALTSLLMFRNLHESERKLEEAQRLTHVGYWERDPDTDLITWSDETYRIFGLQPQARILNLAQLPELIHPEDQQIMVQAVAEALRGGRRYDVEYRVVRPNGEVRIVHSQGDVMRDESGRPRRMFGTVQDITERKRAEQRLMAQHTVTQILAEAATLEEASPRILQAVCECLVWDLGELWSIDREAGVLRCVEVWHKETIAAPQFEATSRTSTFMPGTGLLSRVWSSREPAYIPDVVHDSSFLRAPIAAREGLHAAFAFPILLGGDVLGVIAFFSHEIRQPDQDLLNMMATIGSQIGQFIERKRAEEALRASEASLAEGQQISHTGSWRWNMRTGEVHGSAEHSRIFGFDPAVGPRFHLRYRERVHPDDRPGLMHLLNNAIRDKSAFQHDYRIVLPDGVVKHVQLAGRPDTDASGDLEFVGTIIDVTERKRAEEALHNAQSELARVARLTMLGELTASIAHEINQPLGAVVNNASACVRWLAAQNLEEARRSAALVIADGHRAAEIISRIRALAKRAPPHKDWLDLNSTIRDVIALAQSEVHRNGVTVETHLAADVPRVLGDRIQLQQVLLNLLMNAIEAMSSVGVGPRALWVSSERVAATEVLIAVGDSGPGFDPQSLDRLFDAFYTTKPHGLGLGLAISRRIIEAHGGRLWATANAPHGAVLQFTVPTGREGGA
jgi:PAS domain S-box-containing protein